jgi:cysteine desulfurase
MTQAPIYMDHNATAPVLPEARAAVAEALSILGNASSVHGFGRRARQEADAARGAVAALVGARPEDVVFTSGGTEANNLALANAGERRILVSAIEHDSILRAAPEAELIPVDGDGVVLLEALTEALARPGAKPALVSLMLANNETGVVQPVAEAAAIARRHGAVVHCDAVQAAGKIAVDIRTLGADMLTLSAHKLGGPMGVGALVLGENVALRPTLLGGGQESWRRAGTENLSGIAGFAAAAYVAARSLSEAAGLAALRDEIERRVLDIATDAPIYGRKASRLPNTACIGMPGVKGETQVMAFDLAGIAVSAGAACSSGKVQASAVLQAMGVKGDTAGQAIRVSLGRGNGPADAGRFVAAWKELYGRARRLKEAA